MGAERVFNTTLAVVADASGVPGAGLLVEAYRSARGHNDRSIRDELNRQLFEAVDELERRVRETAALALENSAAIEELKAFQTELIYQRFAQAVARGAGERKIQALAHAAANLQITQFGDAAARQSMFDRMRRPAQVPETTEIGAFGSVAMNQLQSWLSRGLN